MPDIIVMAMVSIATRQHSVIQLDFNDAGGDLLEKLLREKKAISERRVAVHVAIPVLITLNWLHGVGIIHRSV